MMEGLRRDLGLALRMLARTPGVTALAVITLALGIGANTAIFSAADALLLRPLPYPHAARIYTIGTRSRQNGENDNISIGQYLLLRSHCQACAAVAALDAGAGSNLSGGTGRPLRVSSAAVTGGYFPLLGLPLVLGRNFSAAEQAPGAAGVVIVSQSLWRQRYGGDAAILGRGVEVNGRAATIIGVAPDADGPGIDLWMPLDPHAAAVAAQGPNIETLVRLRPGVSPSQFQAELDLLSAAYHRIARKRYTRRANFWATSYHQDVVGPMASQVIMLLFAAGLVLIIACVNVGNLLLSRANTRRQEMALRTALGAGRGRLVRQLLTESVLLAIGGGALGLLLAWGLLPLLRRFLNPVSAFSIGAAPLPVAIGTNGTVLLFAFALAVVTGVLFGLVPAAQATSGDLYGAIKQEGAQTGGGRRRRRASNTLVIVEMALACTLLAAAGLVLVSFWRIAHQPVGFATNHVLTLETSLTGPRQNKPALAAVYVASALRRARRVPGVVAAAATVGIPLVRGMNGGFRASGPHPQGYGQWLPVTPEFFSTLQLPIVAGRAFTAADTAGSEPVCIVSADLARRFWPHQNPVGQQITLATPRRVVGVAAAARMMAAGYRQMFNVYVPMAQASAALFSMDNRWFSLAFLARTRGHPADSALAVERAIQAADPNQPLFGLRTLDQVRGLTLVNFRWITLLIAAFAALALVLSAIGIYGVMAHAVGQRTREIGIRLALGARQGQIQQMILGQALAVAAVGAGIGLFGAWAAASWLSSQIANVGTLNGWLLAAAVVILLLAAAVAAYRPARRAMRVDPLTALRQE
ncbi:MAG: ADOP family duplicated permease [Terriglobales bacterium]